MCYGKVGSSFDQISACMLCKIWLLIWLGLLSMYHGKLVAHLIRFYYL